MNESSPRTRPVRPDTLARPQVTGPAVPRNRRFANLRQYRRMIDRAAIEVYEGRRPASDLVALTGAMRQAAEILVAERQLAAEGGGIEALREVRDVEEAGDTLPEGVDVPRNYKRRRVTARHGVDRNGRPVHEVLVTVDDDEERRAELAALDELLAITDARGDTGDRGQTDD